MFLKQVVGLCDFNDLQRIQYAYWKIILFQYLYVLSAFWISKEM